MSTRTISIWVNNRPGVLASVSGLFAGFGTNIDKLTVGHDRDPGVVKMKIAASIEDGILENVVTQMENLENVIQVQTADTRTVKLAYLMVVYSLFVTVLGLNIASPLYAVYKEQWQLTSGMITLVFASYAFVVIPSIVLFGQLSDRIGPRKILITGICMALTGSICFAFANGMPMLLLARVFQGLSAGMFNGVAVAAMTMLKNNQDRHKTAFVAALAVTAGNAIGPVLSGALAEYAPFPTKLPYLLHVVLVIPGIIGLIFVHMKSAQPQSVRFRWPVISRDIRKAFYTASATSFTAWAVISLFMSVIPAYMNVWIGKSSFIISGLMMVLVLGVSMLSQILLKRIVLVRMIAVGCVMLSLGLVGIVITIVTHSLTFLILSSIFIGAGHGPLYAGSLTSVNNAAPDASRGDTVSFFYSFTFLGVSFPVLVLGYAIEWLGLAYAVVLFVGIMGSLLIISLIFWSKIHGWRK